MQKLGPDVSVVKSNNKLSICLSSFTLCRLRERFPESVSLPISAKAECHLQRLQAEGIIKYSPGAESWSLTNSSQCSLADTDQTELGRISQGVLQRLESWLVAFVLQIHLKSQVGNI